MSMKKKLGSKLADSVHQVKTLSEQKPAVAPTKIAPPAKKPAPQPTSASATAKPKAVNNDSLHPLRVWPD